MILRLAVLVSLGCLAIAGPVAWDDSKCAQKCNGGSKYQYSQQTSYIYSYEASNELKADRTSDLSMKMKATVTITAVSKCEMVLEIAEAQFYHGPELDTSLTFIEKLQRNPLPFAWNDGKIEHICPNPDDSDEVNNIKKGILSAFQNTMRSFEYSAYNTETDVLGSCDTEYKTKETGVEKFEITKIKNVPTCSSYLKGQSLMLASFYQSAAHQQHLPFLSDERTQCKQIIQSGIVDEVTCSERAFYRPLSEYGYVVEVKGESKLKMISSDSASRILYKTPKKESLSYKYKPHSHKNDNAENEARLILGHICENSQDVLKKEAGTFLHKLVYTIRQMDAQSLERVHTEVKSNRICNSGKKILGIYEDALKLASSGGAMTLLTKLATTGEMNLIDSLVWLTLMPFRSYVEEDSIAAIIPLLKKDYANRQSLLGTTALTYKYCTLNSDCESSQAVKDVSSNLKLLLGDRCHTESQEDETQVLTALKAFGNLGYVGESREALFECAIKSTNKIQIRIAAIEAFRRSPCSEEISSKLLDIYSDKAEQDEVRIAALISLSRCATSRIVKRVLTTYTSETSRQVEVFTWSFLENLRSSSDPLKANIADFLEFTTLKEPHSTDITKFSRNFEWSLFSELLNLGGSIEANVIHSTDSFLPRSGSLRGKLDLFGNQVEPIEVGGRVEDLEHILEKVFGPVGLLANIDVEEVLSKLPEKMKRFKRSVETYQSKIEALSERLSYSRGNVPRATAFVRVMGHELGLVNLNQESLKRIAGFRIQDIIDKLASLREVDTARALLFIDVSVLFPSITGRAYNLAANGSLSFGLKSDGKIDLRGSTLFSPRVDIDTKLSPSILADVTASLTIKSEDFEPGVLAKTVLNAGMDMRIKAEIRDGKLVHIKLARQKMKSEIFSMKRTLYYMNHRGQIEMPKLASYNLNYCTKYLQKIIGAKYCGSLIFPHIYSDGKPKIPFIREMEMSLSVEQTDTNMDGYEFLLELPGFTKQPDRKFKILFDTPNSIEDHKFAYELDMKHPDDTSCSISSKLHTPFYSLDLSANMLNADDQLRMNVDVLGDGRRRYSLNVDAAKVVKGARLVEYQPRIVLSLPSTRPIELTGTLVFSKGRKEQLSINLESRSFSSPFTVKGNLAKEGERIGSLDSNWKLTYEFNANAFSQIHRIDGGIGYVLNKGLFLDMGHHYEPDGRSYESITVKAKVENIKIFGRLGFTIDAQVLFAEHQDLNTMLKWDFSFRPLNHLKSDFIFRYGENFEDDTHLVRSTISSVLHGDFNSFHKMSFENKLGLTISCLNFDKSASLITIWDFVEEPKLIFEAGVKSQKDKEIKFELNYKHLESKPRKIKTEMTFTYNAYKFKYRDEANEIAPHEYEWKSVIEPVEGKQITTDYIYRIKSQDNFHHEVEGTIRFPGLQEPVQHKGFLMFDERKLKLNTDIDFSRGTSYVLNLQLEKEGMTELKLATPFIEGNLVIDNRSAVTSVRADFKSKGRDDRRIVVVGSVTPGDTSSLDLEVQWDADKDAQKKVTLKMTLSNEVEDGIDKHIISGSVNYVGSINVDISGSISTDLIRGPHFFRAEFSGNMEPMAVEIDHEIKDGHMKSVIRYLRSGVEKIRMDVKGKLIHRGYNHFEIEGGAFLSSPYKTFDGKLVFFRLMADSNDNMRSFISEYRLKLSPAIGYEGKLDYQRKRGWPGHIRSNLLATKHNRPLYEGSTNVEYGNGKYSFKASFTPLSKKKINFLASFEHSSRFVAFHHSISTYLQYLQTIEVNAVADLRNMEDAKVHSNFDINTHKLYDVNGTLKMRSMLDFDAEMTLFSKITPSLKIFSKSQASGGITKYDMNLNIDSKSILTGSGELKKRKRGFSGDIVFKYKEKEILVLTLNQDGKGKNERNYVIKLKFPSRLYTANIKVNKEKKGLVTYNTKFCRNEELCIEIDAIHKEYDIGYEWQITYRRDDIEFSIERIRESSRGFERFHTVIYHGDHRYGYDVRLGAEGPAKSLSLGIILPSREIIIKSTAEFSLSKPRLQLELSSDGRNHPDRKLTIDTRFENHLRDSNPSKISITVTHPIFEKPIEIMLSGDYESSSDKFFTAEMSLDYSNDPNDKLIGKLSIEKLPRGSGMMLINLYHKDEQHLDFVIKANGTFNSDEDTLGITYNWKEDDADKEAYMIASYPKKEERFYFVYQRPRISYRLDGKMTSPESLVEDKCEINLESVYNGESTKAKLVSDYETGCYTLTILDEDKVSRVVELCINIHSRKLLSLVTESFDDEGVWTFDGLLEIVQKSLPTLGIKVQVNPEFLGKTLFLMVSLTNELDRGGVGTLPFYDSPQFQAVRRTFTEKVLDPAKNFIIPEAQKFVNDMKNDITFLNQALTNHYHKLPSLDAVTEKVQEIRKFVRTIAHEIWLNIYSYYEGCVRTVLEHVDKFRNIVKEKCNNNTGCRSLVRSYQTEGWKGLLRELRTLLLSLPELIDEFLENPSVDVPNYLKSLTNILKAVLHPLTKYKCGEIVVKVVQLSYEHLQPPIRAFMSRIPNYYKAIKQRLATNEYVKLSVALLKDGYWQIRERILNIDYQKLVVLAQKWLEDCITSTSLPSTKHFVVINVFDPEKGIADVDIHNNVGVKITNRIQSAILMVVDRAMDIGQRYNWNTGLIIFKRALDLNFFPPYDAQAVLIGHQHYVTFDKVIYDFAGECAYLLSRDFQDGNFTIALKPKEGDRAASILVMKGQTSIEINNVQIEVKVDDKAVDLPHLTEDIAVTREGSTVIVDTRNGMEVKCNLVHEICIFVLSGWYYGKTAGLLGTYNYESADEFKRPKGQVANSVTVFAKSWELKRGCKTQNLVPEVPIKQNSAIYKECKAHFQAKSSPLAACFGEVPPEEYFQLCTQLFPGEQNAKKSLCNAAAAYVMECESKYVELNLPAKCLTCNAPDGSTLEHGDRKKFEKLNKKSANVVFIVEDHQCNKVFSNELGNLARSIEKELQNEGFRDNMFGVVGFGGDIGDPQVFTVKDRIFFGSRDINSITQRLKLEYTKTEESEAFEAIQHAVTHLTKSDASKSFVLLSCTPCRYDYTSILYPIIQQILLERGITLHVIHSAEITIRKTAVKEKDIIGVDPDTVFHTKDVTQPDLIGEPDLRSQVVIPKDLCIALSQDVNGSFFSSDLLSKSSSNEVKNWRSVFARKFLKSAQLFSCQWCDCTSTTDHIPNTVCQPCEIKRPRLPFSVGSNNASSRTVNAFLSYLLHIIRE